MDSQSVIAVCTLGGVVITTLGMIVQSVIQRDTRSNTRETRKSVGDANGQGSLQDQITALSFRQDAFSEIMKTVRVKLGELDILARSYTGSEGEDIRKEIARLSAILDDLHEYTHEWKHSITNKTTGNLIVADMLETLVGEVRTITTKVERIETTLHPEDA